jgi:hypothetical protein
MPQSHISGSRTSDWRPKEDLDGAARMSCTRHQRGAPWPPGPVLGETTASRGGRAFGSGVLAGRRPSSWPSPPLVLPFTHFAVDKKSRGGVGAPPPLGRRRRSVPAGGARGGPTRHVGRRCLLSDRAGGRATGGGFEQQKREGRTPAAGRAPLSTGRRGSRRACSTRWPPRSPP